MRFKKQEIFCNWHFDWPHLFRRCNWYDFDIFVVRCEYDRELRGFEASLIILGIGLRVRWNFDKRVLEEMHKEADSGESILWEVLKNEMQIEEAFPGGDPVWIRTAAEAMNALQSAKETA